MANADFTLAEKILEAHLQQATSGRSSNDSIHINPIADPAEMTREISDRDVAVQILDRQSAQVRRLRAAIDRIKDGSYGFCLECEEEIAPKRLKAIPWAELCIHCQEATDRAASGEPTTDLAFRLEAA
jgi:DnaK suppressor protein